MDIPAEYTQSWSRRIIPSSIRFKIIIPYIIVTLAIASIGTYVVTWLVTDSIEERFINQLQAAGSVMTEAVVSQEQLRLDVSRMIANTAGIAEAAGSEDWQKVEGIVRPIMGTSTGIDHVLIVDINGKEVRRFYRDMSQQEPSGFNTQINSGVDLRIWPSVSQVLADSEGKTKVVEIAIDEVTRELMIYTVIPMPGIEGLGGAVLAGNYLKNQARTLKELSTADAILLSPQRKVLASTLQLGQAEQSELARLLPAARYQQILVKQYQEDSADREILFDEIRIGSQEYKLTYAPFILQGQSQGLIAVALPTNFVTETTALNRSIFIGVFSFGVIVVLGIGFFVAQQIIGPISRLVTVSKAITAGDLDQRSGLTGEDEVAILAANFDTMTTELQHKNQSLEEQAGRLQAILSSMADGVIVRDMFGRTLTQNPAIDEIIKQIKSGLKRSGGEDANKDPWPQLLRSIDNLDHFEPRKIELGQQTLSAVAAPVTTSDEQAIGSVVVLRDITREVESEKLKDNFISSTSHELKTPLTAMKGYQAVVDMMVQQSSKKLDERIYNRVSGNLTKIKQQIYDLDNVVQSMLDLSQIDADAFDVEPEPLDLVYLLETIGQQWQDKMADKELTFELTLPEGEDGVWINGNHERITQVLQHLIKNTHDYTLVGRVDIILQKTDDKAEIIIKDTGVGILEEDMRYLFTRFFRAIHEQSTYAIAGAGLGLYLSKAIIELHDGYIQVDSEEYSGTTVRVVLPAIDPPDDDWDDDDW
ncbi:ATP-binding protein [Anaerolineales bacterium HSG24]|nr:ATP-binding protein [Anaerolineales bacterium HSG24]